MSLKHLDHSRRLSGSLLYEQVEAHYAQLIQRGILPADAALPAAATLARELGVNHLTVRRAYKRLEEKGLVRCVQGRGTFVSAAAARPVIGIVTWLSQLSSASAPGYNLATLERLVRVVEADGYEHRTLLLTTSRHDMYRGRWNDHDLAALGNAPIRAAYVTGTDLPGWFVEQCRKVGVPLVGVNAATHRGDAGVDFSAQSMAVLAGQYLKKSGRKRPALLFLDTKPGGNRSDARRTAELLREAGGFAKPIQTVGVRQPTAYCGQVAARRLLEADRRLDSIVCLDDVLNQGVCFACMEKGVRVPTDVLIVSHANKGLTPPFPVPVARMDCDHDRAVEVARQMMHRLLRGERIDNLHTALEPVLVPEHVLQDGQVDLHAEAV